MNNNFSKNRVPIIIMLVDIIVVLFSVFLSVQIRGNFTWSAFHGGDIARSFIIILIVRCICFLIFKTNKILIRFFSSKDIFKLSWINLIGSAVFVATNLISLLVKDIHVIPYSIVIMEFFFTSFLMIFYRMVLKSISTDNNSDIPLKNILIFGAGELGSMTIRAITHENKYKIVGFLDEDTTKIGKTIKGYSIFALNKLEQLLKEKNISFLIIAIENLSIEKRTQITDIATAYNVKIL
ncbi:MAG: Gfo/Idh/MocA family oxidoreductase, partial [Bacteroidales bacterium]|nr:Gfo/Idh/MocA family oxidoreductase [Bacteroidales bacterium]